MFCKIQSSSVILLYFESHTRPTRETSKLHLSSNNLTNIKISSIFLFIFAIKSYLNYYFLLHWDIFVTKLWHNICLSTSFFQHTIPYDCIYRQKVEAKESNRHETEEMVQVIIAEIITGLLVIQIQDIYILCLTAYLIAIYILLLI